MDLVQQLVAIVTPVLICIALGVLWARLGTPFESGMITSLIYNIGVPCLILATFHKVDLPGRALAELAGATLVCYAAAAAIAAAALRAMRLDLTAYLPSLMFPLTGSMGLPVCYFAFGDEGLALGIVYFTFGAIGTFTIGAAIAEGRASARRLLGSPIIYAVAIVIALEAADAKLPTWVFNTTNLLGGMVIPAQLVALGVSLLELRPGGMARSGALGLFRLALGAAVGFAVAEAFGLTGAARAVVVLQSAMPVAVSSYLFALKFQRRPEEVAGMVLTSMVASFATIPLILAVVL